MADILHCDLASIVVKLRNIKSVYINCGIVARDDINDLPFIFC